MGFDAGAVAGALSTIRSSLSEISGQAADLSADLQEVWDKQDQLAQKAESYQQWAEDLRAMGAELDTVTEKANRANQALEWDSFDSQGEVQTAENGDLVVEPGIFGDGT